VSVELAIATAFTLGSASASAWLPTAAPVAAGQPLCRGAVGVDDELQPRIVMAGDVPRVDRADAARAKLAETDHS